MTTTPTAPPPAPTSAPASVSCLECDAPIGVAAPELHEIVECGECLVELEVTGTAPLTLDLAPEVEEDWGE